MDEGRTVGINKAKLLEGASREDVAVDGHLHEIFHQHQTLGQTLLELEGFGVWMLSLEEAAELIACDLWATGDVDAPALNEYSGSLISMEVRDQLANVKAIFLPKLTNAIEIGRLTAGKIMRDFDEVIIPDQTFIDYTALCGWLEGRGYSTGDAFEEWYDRALNISDRLVEEQIWLRRAAKNEIQAMPATIGFCSIQTIDKEAGVEALANQLKSALLENQHLRERLAKAESARQETTQFLAKRSHLLATAALIKLLEAPVERPRLQGMKQAAIKDAILERFTVRGLKERNLDEIFAAANKAMSDAE